MSMKTFVHNGVLISLLFVGGYYIFFGPQSVWEYRKQTNHLNKQQRRVTRLEDDIIYLKKANKEWNTNPLPAQNMARYDLGLGFTNELIYLTSSQ